MRESVLALAGVCLFIVALDLACRPFLPASYHQFYTEPLFPRMFRSCLRSLEEEVLYRLILTTLLASIPLLWRRQPGRWWIVGAIVLAQLVNVHAVVAAAPPWGILRFWVVGCVWGWLYWRHGFLAALLTHGSAHLMLDPLLLGLLR